MPELTLFELQRKKFASGDGRILCMSAMAAAGSMNVTALSRDYFRRHAIRSYRSHEYGRPLTKGCAPHELGLQLNWN